MKFLKRVRFFFLFLALSCALFSCSKEKRVEREVQRVGEWNVDQVNYTGVVQEADTSSASMNVEIGTAYDAGTFTFDKDGRGRYDYTIAGINKTGSFSWSVNDDASISLLRINYNINLSTTTFQQRVLSLEMKKTGKKKYYLTGGEAEQGVTGSSAGQYALGLEIYLSKK